MSLDLTPVNYFQLELSILNRLHSEEIGDFYSSITLLSGKYIEEEEILKIVGAASRHFGSFWGEYYSGEIATKLGSKNVKFIEGMYSSGFAKFFQTTGTYPVFISRDFFHALVDYNFVVEISAMIRKMVNASIEHDHDLEMFNTLVKANYDFTISVASNGKPMNWACC